MDARIVELATVLVQHSLSIKKGDTIEINCGSEARELVNEIAKQVLLKGAYPRINCSLEGYGFTYFKYASNEQLRYLSASRVYEAEKTDGFITIGTEHNTKELSSVAAEKIALRRKATKPLSEIVLKKDNWVICLYPTNALAQDAEMSLTEFENFLYDASLQDWKKEEINQEKIRRALDRGTKVRVVGKNTDLTFSIKGRQAIKCFGKRNLPDGEVFIAPVETTTEGSIHYDYPVIYANKEIQEIRLTFRKGKVVKATASKNEDLLRKMIRLDPGASRLGEFGIGTNFKIKRFTKQILCDEKIGGTVHLALGMAYKKGGGRNESALHWDMIKDLRKNGAVYIDGRLLEKEGKFVI